MLCLITTLPVYFVNSYVLFYNLYNIHPILYFVRIYIGKNPPYKTTNGYKAQDADELSIEEGKTVEILKKSISGWWIVKYNSKIGLFPATYLQELDSEGKYYRSVPESQKRAVPRK